MTSLIEDFNLEKDLNIGVLILSIICYQIVKNYDRILFFSRF